MKPIEITKQDALGYEHTFVIRHDKSTNKVFLAEVDLDFGCESFRGVFGSEAYKWAAVMSCKADDSCSVQKHTYNVSFHNIG